ncbi:GmrSD restriction endonuclease domain-containing protein [Arthrobacter sp. TB 26]|uniref:GmrSD restriction endonuclease domain-containing protein n=1 Tax=Arthrobacter sp. TB 26 TaxID=494420 RepID=UPI00046296EE|nr:DUF1524 domain-containing protein [Arthrobacter sp. TB 26]
MNIYKSLLGPRDLSVEAPKPPKKPKASTFVVGALALIFMALGGATGGIGGALIFLGIFAAMTGLFVLATGRRSWARLPGGRKTGGIVLAASLVLVMVGGLTTTAKPKENLDASAASDSEKRAASPSSSATTSSTPSPKASATETGAPLDPDNNSDVAVGVSYAAPRTQPAYATKALDLLDTLVIKGRAPKTGYDRAMFGQAWADVDRNGCDTRNDTLKRDLTDVKFTNSVPCKVQSGNLSDPYTGKSINFLRGAATSSAVQIDHVVALSDAWQKGAQQLSLEQRTSFANDPLNLQSTDGPTNMQKGDGDAATWLPPNKSYRCEYVARQISVKATYSLWVTQAEHDAMARILGDCTGQLAPTSEKAPPAPEPVPSAAAVVVAPAPAPYVAPAPAPAPAPYVAPAPAPAPAPYVPPAPAPAPAPYVPPAPAAYYANCTAVKQAGAAPIYAGQPGYSRSLDRDGDGIACEK